MAVLPFSYLTCFAYLICVTWFGFGITSNNFLKHGVEKCPSELCETMSLE
jgi:hypothetical protein